MPDGKPGRILFRADASSRIGTGHVMRCLAIARELKRRHWQVAFASHALPDPLIQLLRSHDCSWIPLSEPSDVASLPPGWDWIVLDHYQLDQNWFAEVAALGGRWMAIDDLGDRPFGCHVLLDSNLGVTPAKYQGRVAKDCQMLLGPRYAPLHPEYGLVHQSHPPHPAGPVSQVVISLGGADPLNVTALALEAARRALPEATLHVVIGPAYPHALPMSTERVVVHQSPPGLTTLLAQADLAIGAAGSSAWERCALGVPSVMVQVADNQRAIAQELEKAGAGLNAGLAAELDVTRLAEQIRMLASDPDRRHAMSQMAYGLVDGRGCERIGHVLEGIHVRPISQDDEQLLWRWANDPTTRANSFSSDPIPLEQHQRWLRARLQDPDCQLWIGENGAGPLGQVRFDRHGSLAEIGISVAPEHRGGVGRLLLDTAIQAYRKQHPDLPLRAQVKPSNQPSLRLFQSLGFHVIQTSDHAIELERKQ